MLIFLSGQLRYDGANEVIVDIILRDISKTCVSTLDIIQQLIYEGFKISYI